MTFIPRALTEVIERFSKFPVVVILGPRQSGKTTLAQAVFKKHTYVTLEDPAIREALIKDPKKFLREYENETGIIFDEFQYAPQLLSYIQIESDAKDRPGYFVLTGSQNFLMNEAITQSLAGRAGILTLLPLSIRELQQDELLDSSEQLIFKGGYPRIYAKNIEPTDFYSAYIHTYIERDVRQLITVENLMVFQKFLGLCAGRIGQLLNIEDIATNCGIDRKTVKNWLSILQASYVIFLLPPYFNNFNKRLTKTPKLYFYDTGLACALLGIKSAEELQNSFFRGPLFESFIMADLYKQYYNLGSEPPLYFWRDLNGRIEVDCLIKQANKIIPVEIKSGETIVKDFFGSIGAWSEMADQDPAQSYIVYGGKTTLPRSGGKVIGWQTAGNLVEEVEKKRK